MSFACPVDVIAGSVTGTARAQLIVTVLDPTRNRRTVASTQGAPRW